MPGNGGGRVLTPGADRATRSPFPGLQPFSDSDEDGALFAGRDAEIDLVVANLRAASLTIFYGPSGAGKSSLLHAGVVRRIRARASAARATGAPAATVILHDEWAGDPAAVLARRIADDAGVTDGDLQLDKAIERWCDERQGMLLLILDQFEEYLRLHPIPAVDAFDRLFPEVADRPDLPVHIIISLRDDALAELDRFEGRMSNLFDNYLRLPRMTPAAARQAIEQPIARVNEWRRDSGLAGVEIEDGVVGEVLAQLEDSHLWSHETGVGGGHDGAAVEPAFLQLVMKRLWDADAERQPPLLRRETLAQLGGAAAIVRDHLDSAMAALTRAQQDTAAEAFGYLVTPSGAKIRYTAEDLADYAKRPVGAVRDVLETLARPQSRIIRRVPAPSGDADREGYEIFHDVLAGAVRGWSQRIRTARLELRTARLTAALAATVAIAVALVAYATEFAPLEKLELSTVDLRFGLRGDIEVDPKIALVGLDKRTLQQLPGLTRREHGRVLDAVFAGAPAAIVEGFEFEEGARGNPGTPELRRAVRRAHGRLVLATERLDNEGKTTLFGERKRKQSFLGGARAAYSGFFPDADEKVRLVQHEGRQRDAEGKKAPGAMPTIAVAAAARAANERFDTRPFPKDGRGAWIDFAGGPGTYRSISYLDVLRGAVAPGIFRDRIVVIGPTDGRDQLRTSADGGTVMSPPEVQANAIATVRAGLPLRDVRWPITAALIAGLALLASLFALRFAITRALALSAAAGVLMLAGSQLAFHAGSVATVVYPLLALVLCAALNLIAALAARTGRRGRAAFTAAPAGQASPTAPWRKPYPGSRRP